jgi:hypothetical protein
VRAIGFVVLRVPVDLAAGRTGTADVRLDRAASLAAVTVFGTPASPSLLVREFLDRRRQGGFGRFVTAEDLARCGHGRDRGLYRPDPRPAPARRRADGRLQPRAGLDAVAGARAAATGAAGGAPLQPPARA